jgi:hypothetical protein
MFAVARFLLEISQRTYPVASRMMKLSGRSSTIHGGGRGERMACRDDSVTSAVHPIADISLRRTK